jgi:hypothetical protein
VQDYQKRCYFLVEEHLSVVCYRVSSRTSSIAY